MNANVLTTATAVNACKILHGRPCPLYIIGFGRQVVVKKKPYRKVVSRKKWWTQLVQMSATVVSTDKSLLSYYTECNIQHITTYIGNIVLACYVILFCQFDILF